MQENAAQRIRQNKIFRGCMPPPPPSQTSRLRFCNKCIGQILGLDPALSRYGNPPPGRENTPGTALADPVQKYFKPHFHVTASLSDTQRVCVMHGC